MQRKREYKRYRVIYSGNIRVMLGLLNLMYSHTSIIMEISYDVLLERLMITVTDTMLECDRQREDIYLYNL